MDKHTMSMCPNKDALKGLDTGVLQSIADATLTRIYLQKAQAEARHDQRQNA